VVVFGECAFDADRRQVLRAGAEVHISRKAFDLLGILIACQPRVVSKGELQERLWPSTFVVEGNLSNLVAEVRRALQDDAHRPRYIRTVHGFGYAFCGATSADDQPSTSLPVACWLALGESKLPLTRGEHLIGRSPQSIVPIDDMTISRHHARIIVGEEVTLIDLGSRNGTYVRGQRISTPSTLHHGDRVTVGSLMLTVLMPQPQGATTDDTTAAADTEGP
jgi:DNA-binding winged helix-turn-helix (wHTH) protein